MLEYIWLTLSDCPSPPAVCSVSTADRHLNCRTAQGSKRGALADWLAGMIATARANGMPDDKILADFAEGVARFRAEYAGEIEPTPLPTHYPWQMDFADQFSCVLTLLAEDPTSPTWFEDAARDTLAIAGRILAGQEVPS